MAKYGRASIARAQSAVPPVAEAWAPLPQTRIAINGAEHAHGEVLSIQGQKVTLVTEKALAASPMSGIAAGTYPVVSVVVQPGERTAYRAVVGGILFPIQLYGTSEETIAKIRDRGTDRKGRQGAGGENGREVGDIALTATADRILSEYLAYDENLDGATYSRRWSRRI